VIVIDDAAAVRTRLVARLREAGLEVIGESGESDEGFCMVRTLSPDAVVVDVRLADGGGIDLLVAVKAARPAPFVVVITDETRYKARCLALGADLFLDKASEFEAVAPALIARTG
jgi:DNA-binding NarL/FixJ family response regulator